MNELEEVRRRIGFLVHDLSQPLNTIALSCFNLQNRAKSEQSDLSNRYVIAKMDTVLQAVAEAGQLLEDIKKLCKDRQ